MYTFRPANHGSSGGHVSYPSDNPPPSDWDCVTVYVLILTGFTMNVSIANKILALDVVVPDDAETKGLLGVRNGDSSDDLQYPNGTQVTPADSTAGFTLTEMYNWGVTCE